MIEDNTVLVPVCVDGLGGKKVFTSYIREVALDSCRVILGTEWNVIDKEKSNMYICSAGMTSGVEGGL